MLVVQKFGGTSVATIQRIKDVALTVMNEVALGNSVIVVLSAMSGETNRLIDLFTSIATDQFWLNKLAVAEYDAAIATGEQVSCALLAGYLNTIGHKARSLTGWQVPIVTNNLHSKAVIQSVQISEITNLLQAGVIPVITGFQGVSNNQITTLGRGGSDTTAVAVAAALKADRCDIYTDVDGIYSADPRVVHNAKRLDSISHEEVIEMASSGAKVLEPRSAILAMIYGVTLRILNSMATNTNPLGAGNSGTVITNDKDGGAFEKQLVTSVVSTNKEAQIVVKGVPAKPGYAAKLFAVLARQGIQVDVIAQSSTTDNSHSNIAFTVNKDDLALAKRELNLAQSVIGYTDIVINSNIAKISIIGLGMKSNAGIAHKVFDTLGQRNINIDTISTSEIKITVLVDADVEELAVRTLHSEFLNNQSTEL